MALSMDSSSGKLTFTLKGLQFKLHGGENIKLTVQNGRLAFFEITANGRQAIFKLTEAGKRFLEFISHNKYIDIARCAISALSAGCTAAEFIERAWVGEAVFEVGAEVAESVVTASSTAAAVAGKTGFEVGTAVADSTVRSASAAGAVAGVADDVAQTGYATAVGAGMSAGVITAVGGGVGIFMGILDVGVGVNNIFNGTATVNQLKEAKELIVAAAQREDPDSGKSVALQNASKIISQLSADAETHSRGTNRAKIGSGILGTFGGGMAIAGITACPPLAIPGSIASVVGAILNIGATYVDVTWNADHKQRLKELENMLLEDDISILNKE